VLADTASATAGMAAAGGGEAMSSAKQRLAEAEAALDERKQKVCKPREGVRTVYLLLNHSCLVLLVPSFVAMTIRLRAKIKGTG